MGDTANPFRVLIAGAGPAGLVTAQALKKRGFHCTVFEQDAALDARPRDWNFGIYWAQVPLGECLSDDLSKLVIEKGQVDRRPQSADDVMPVYNGETGELMKNVSAPNSIRLHRRNFLRILTNEVDVRYGKRLQKVESDGNTVTVHFEDGTSDSGNLLIGAEGAHSKVRDFLMGAEEARPTKSPIYAIGTMAKLPKDSAINFQTLHPRYTICFHPNGEFLWTGVHDNFENTQPGDWTFMIILSWLPKDQHDPLSLQGADILPYLKQKIQAYAEPWKSIIESIPDDTQCWHNQLSYWIPRPWDNHNGTVTLIGDAAHPMTFHRGQGLNNAIHDANSLATQLASHGINTPTAVKAAIDAYETELIERGKMAVEGSNANSLATHDWKTLLQSPLFTSGLSRPGAPAAAAEAVPKEQPMSAASEAK